MLIVCVLLSDMIISIFQHIQHIIKLWGNRKARWQGLCLALLLISFLSAACTSFDSSSNAGPKATAGPPALSLRKLHWCGKPSMLFRDEGADIITHPGTPVTDAPTTVTDWGRVKANLGFTLFLPGTLPGNTCLLSVFGTIHDAVFGGSFTISFLLANHDSISLSEAPLRSQNTTFQCSSSPDGTPSANVPKAGTATATVAKTQASSTPVQLCTGARNQTNIVFSARGTTSFLQQFFHNLQPDIDWMPA